MLSLSSVKKIKSLKTKKGRDAEKLFLIEGKRSVEEYLLKSDLVNEVLVSKSEIKNYDSILNLCNKKKIKISLANIPDGVFVSESFLNVLSSAREIFIFFLLHRSIIES